VTKPLAIVLWLWSDHRGRRANVYRPDDVARCARSISRNLHMPHEIVCITDFPAHEFPSDIRVIPLWDDWRNCGGCYCRLRAFAPDMAEIIAPRFAWMDIDMLVTGDLTPVLSRREDAVFWRSCTVPTLPYNGSMVLQTAGARAQVWRDFDPDASPKITRGLEMVGTDQAWIAHRLGPEEAVWTPAGDGVVSFRRDCRGWLPNHARLVFFPGAAKPTNSRVQLMHPWITKHMEGRGKWPRQLNPRMVKRERRIGRREQLKKRAQEARATAEASLGA
jgi:hypothetical protein